MSKIRKIVRKMVVSQEVLRLAKNFSFLPSDHTDDSGKIFLVFLGMIVNTYLQTELHFLYTAHLKIVRGNSLSCIDCTSHEKQTYPVIFYL
jgi:hypothetical protein